MSASVRDLTHVEQLIWVGQRMAGHEPIYNMALAISLHGIEPQRFTDAYQRVSTQFAPLRASLRSDDEGPVLDFSSLQPNALDVLDFRSEDDAQQAAQDWMNNAASEPFLPREALCRSALIRIDDEQYIWFINQHHLVTDAWSCTLLVAAMDRAYHGNSDTEADFAALSDQAPNMRKLTESRLDQARSHWQRVYRSVPQQDAIFGRLNPEHDVASDRVSYCLDADDVRRLQAVADREFPALSSSMSMFIAFSVLLTALISRISRRPRVGFEAPFANRATRIERMTPGLFIELFPLAADIDGATTFADLGRQIQEQVPAAIKFGLPGASVPGGNVGCDAVLNFIPFSLGTFGGEPVRADFVHSGAHDAAHALRLQVWDLQNDGGLTIMFDLNRAVVRRENKDTIVAYFRALMSAFVEDPQSPVVAIPLLSATHRASVVDQFNDIGKTSLPTRPIIESIYAQAVRTPTAIALQCQHRQRSYAEMVADVETIAVELMRLGVSHGDRVCISAARSLELVETILAIMRLGATYVPIDPDYPASRRSAIYDTVQPQLLISEQTTDDAIKGLKQVGLNALLEAGDIPHSTEPALPNLSRLQLADPAYVLFTSGSTGAPKGVPVSQLGLAVYLQWARTVYADEHPVTMPLLTTIAFDLTVTSMFLPLICGGSVVIYRPTTDAFDDSLFLALDDNRVDTVKLTPSHLRLLQRMDLHRSRIRNFIVGGEQLTKELADTIERQFGDVRIFNEYGPTEAVVGCMIHQYQGLAEDQQDSNMELQMAGSSAVPIGRPAHHTRIYLLNNAQQPVHPDVAGEIYIHRAGAPASYLNNLEASAEAFFPDLQSPGETMYRTGDLARFDRHGDMIYLGRADQQVKVAGHRIETAEIESALLRITGIEECSVLLDRPQESSPPAIVHCAACGIGSDTPGIKLDEEGRCNLCRDFSKYAARIDTYFRQREKLKDVIAAAAQRKTGQYDCMALLSGGKDSTYALYQIVGMGFKVYAFTLDNGYVSPQARANIERVVDDLGIDHEFASTEHMPAIFRDSLNRFSNVCQGCFKTIYTLSLRRAEELGIPALVTGLSRGQLFETRLNLGLFRGDRSDDEIDRTVLQARKAYHRRSDAVTRCLGNDEFKDDRIFESIELIDFYRYWSASLTEMLEFLAHRAPWIRPSDTGRSSNCLINDVGIHVHRNERSFHNYALPYSWDVRLRQKDRDQAIEELNDDIDTARVAEILQDIGYEPKQNREHRAEQLVAFFKASKPTDPDQLRDALSVALPSWAVPHRFIQVEEIPLTINGKVDRGALLAKLSTTPSSMPFRAPGTDAEEVTAELWSELLPVPEIGADDNFFELGGTSIEAIEFMTRLCDRFAVNIPLELIFRKPILADVASELESALIAEIAGMSDTEVHAALDESEIRT